MTFLRLFIAAFLLICAPAVVAALHDATGIWFDAFPLTPSRVLARLDESR